MDGETVGFVANQPAVMGGSLDYHASDKMARFIRFCDCFGLPILTLVDVPAFLPGTAQERQRNHPPRGQGAVCLFGGNRSQDFPDYAQGLRRGIYRHEFQGNGSRLCVCMANRGNCGYGCGRSREYSIQEKNQAAPDPEAMRAQCIQEYEERFLNPYVAAARGFVDEVIKPGESREKLLAALKAFRGKKEEAPKKKHGNIPL